MRSVIPNDQPIPFAQMLQKIRVSLGLTQEELAERFGVTANDINLFERDWIVDSETKRKILRQMCFAINWR